jgi:tRNA pseudouridine32 synthase / 23S rRNA pseudouridine746 synthase
MKPIRISYDTHGRTSRSKKRRRKPETIWTSCWFTTLPWCSLRWLLLLLQQQQQHPHYLGLPVLLILQVSFAHAISVPSCHPTRHSVVATVQGQLLKDDAVQQQQQQQNLDRLPETVAPVSKKQRKVVFRQMEWSKSLFPIQHYHGYRLPSQSQQKQRRKTLNAKQRASLPITPNQLHILYRDDSIVVVHKPSGVLSVPGPRRNPNMANMLHEVLGLDNNNNNNSSYTVDHMVVHRLDMDTSGIVVYALNENALRTLHEAFRERHVLKRYHALVCGHVLANEGELDVALERDPLHIPFMRIATTTTMGQVVPPAPPPVDGGGGGAKFLSVAPKPSFTSFRVLSRHYICDTIPVTRLELTPYTGRTHQLRVHCAAMGHAIVGDDIYGYGGDGCAGGIAMATTDAADATAAAAAAYMELGWPLCLHAERLCFHHPVTKAPMMFSAEANF